MIKVNVKIPPIEQEKYHQFWNIEVLKKAIAIKWNISKGVSHSERQCVTAD